MTESVSWIAVRESDCGRALDRLRLKRSDERSGLPDGPIVGVALTSGWYVIHANDCASVHAAERTVRELSEGEAVIACWVDEAAGYSEAAAWDHGHRVWSIAHVADAGHDHIELHGAAPPCYESIRAEVEAGGSVHRDGSAAPDDPFFEIPIEVAAAVTGYRHDYDPSGVGPTPFERLRGTPKLLGGDAEAS